VLADSLALSRSSVYRLLREILPAELAEEAVARYEAGEPLRLIGRALGVSAGRVYRVLKQRGVVRSKSAARAVAHARRREAEDN
jgi:hypothetical protein